MSEKSTLKCPNCQRELKWIPKGKHLCRCGETISSTGEDLEGYNLFYRKISVKDKLPNLIDLQLIFAILLTIGLFIGRVLYQKKWLHYEAEFMSNFFAIDPTDYNEIVVPSIIGVILICWIAYRIIKKLKKTITSHPRLTCRAGRP